MTGEKSGLGQEAEALRQLVRKGSRQAEAARADAAAHHEQAHEHVDAAHRQVTKAHRATVEVAQQARATEEAVSRSRELLDRAGKDG